ncbi:MAG: antitoxin Xre/MbcA/ParS toxin-binding domain-containing protein [Gemmobacter sp.]|uniref:type II RES/Xre toxin-antitoxin system antitoxin n=1 Tax=Gemmobacter sp. TaxID=1898957 RepID=UPI00391D1457
MTPAATLSPAAIAADSNVSRTYALLGGEAAIRAPIRNAIEAHDVLARGLPAASLLHLVDRVGFLEHGDALMKAVGVSLRTVQRRRADPTPTRLSTEQSNRTWRFAAILAEAIAVLGTQAAAEDWMNRPAIGLDNRRPVDLLATAAGAEAVAEYLTRLDYGVYA